MRIQLASYGGLLLCLLGGQRASTQVVADSALLAEIRGIRAIDHHAHPAPWPSPIDRMGEFDVADSIPHVVLPVRLRPSNPEFITAWRELFGYPHSDLGTEHVAELVRTRERLRSEMGAGYPTWVLDRLGIETMFANRLRMGSGLTAPRFRWVWHANPLLFPLDNAEAKRANPQRAADFAADERWLASYLAELGLSRAPATLAEYVSGVIIPLLEQRRRDGAVAVKFYTAYQRPIDFASTPEDLAAGVYARHVGGGSPDAAGYKALQDYLFYRIALECGRIGLAVHVHVGAGAGPFFANNNASPFLLEPLLNDPALRRTTFVLVHGGLPFAEATRVLLGKPNVYADFSSQGFLTSTRALSEVIRSWLELRPEKVLFGTDAYPLTTAIGWEEIAWLSANSGREALAIALTGMMHDGQITRERAMELARMVLRDNAIRLYGLDR